jgi:hypothetical protein
MASRRCQACGRTCRQSLSSQAGETVSTPDGVAWPDSSGLDCDVIIWCTGFRPALDHLAPLRLRGGDGQIPVEGTRAAGEPCLHLLGYGHWSGPASATLIGTARTALSCVLGHRTGLPSSMANPPLRDRS